MVNKVFHGDCLEIMKSIPEGSIDMILCDLPYGTTACKWDIVLEFNDYILFDDGKKVRKIGLDEIILIEYKK